MLITINRVIISEIDDNQLKDTYRTEKYTF